MKGYKAFKSDLTCRGFQYEVGKTYKLEGKLKICENGFHFCRTIADCYRYYRPSDDVRVCEVEATGNVDSRGIKFCTDEITILREVTDERLKRCNLTSYSGGYCNTGMYNTGTYNAGDFNSGSHNTGEYNYGPWNSGSNNSGLGNTGCVNDGSWNTGRCNLGDFNAGSCNEGSRNTGGCNEGNDNSGWFNKGNQNAGDFNSGNHSSGCFCTDDDPKIKMFDADSEWTWSDWIMSDAHSLLKQMPGCLERVLGRYDGEDEYVKKYNDTTGRYIVKHGDADRQAWWDELPDDCKSDVLALPNFDAEKFYKCTGIKV